MSGRKSGNQKNRFEIKLLSQPKKNSISFAFSSTHILGLVRPRRFLFGGVPAYLVVHVVLVQNAPDRFRPGPPVNLRGRPFPQAALGAADGGGPLEQGLKLLAVRLYRSLQHALHAWVTPVAGIHRGAPAPVKRAFAAPHWLPGGAARRPIGREVDRVALRQVAVRAAFLYGRIFFSNSFVLKFARLCEFFGLIKELADFFLSFIFTLDV